MKIIHNIGERWKKEQVESLTRFGFTVREDVFSYIRVEPHQFELIKDIVMPSRPVHAVGASFDKVDMEAADWLALGGLITFGYPQPHDTFDFLDVVYDTSHHCKKCGVNRGRRKKLLSD